MRNLIFKTAFAATLTSLSFAPLAHADRQGGGGMMKVSFSATDVAALEWVRFKGIDADTVSFEYSWIKKAERGTEQVTLNKADFGAQSSELVQALLDSKTTREWTSVHAKIWK